MSSSAVNFRICRGGGGGGFLPSTPLQLSAAAQSNSEEHVYDSIDNYEANPTVTNQQMAPPSSESRIAHIPFSDQLTFHGAVIEYSEEMPTSTYQQEAKTKSNAAESPFNSDHSPHAVAIYGLL